MRILMIGGTEFFGKQIVNQLVQRGHDVTLLTRGNRKPEEFWSSITHIQCDRTNYPKFKQKLHNETFDVVIDNRVMSQSDVQTSLDVFTQYSNPPQYILCSSVAIYFDVPLHSPEGYKEEEATLALQQEDDPIKSYANGKRLAESYLIANHGNVPYTIIRPTVIEGPDDPSKRTWFWIQRIQDGHPILLSQKNKKTKYQHVYVDDVAQAFLLAVGNSKAFNQVYNVAGEKILTIADYVRLLSQQLGCKTAPLCWIDNDKLAQQLPNYSLPFAFNEIQMIENIEKIKKELNYQPTQTEEWLKKKPLILLEKNKKIHGDMNSATKKNVLAINSLNILKCYNASFHRALLR